jgi:thymidylate kinase
MVKRKQKRSEENNDQWDISSREEHDNIFYRYKSRLYSANKTVIEIDTSVSIEDTYRQLDEKLISKYFK